MDKNVESMLSKVRKSDKGSARRLKNTNEELTLKQAMNKIYHVDGQDWYKLYPYVFAIKTVDKNGRPVESGLQFKYALPIPPESIVTQMICATEAVPTLGGVVEEPSSTVFWSIQLSGTMGIAPSRPKDTSPTPDSVLTSMARQFRGNISKTGLLTGMVSSLLKPIDSANQMFKAFQGGITGGIQAINQPFLPYSESAVSGESNGYTEIHNFHRFLVFYSRLNSRKDAQTDALVKDYANEKFGLFFYNYKDGQQFRIVLKNFMIIKTQTSPYLYRYQCQFKGWDIAKADKSQGPSVDRFGPKGDLASVNTATITSTLTATKKLLRSVKTGVTDPLGTFLSTPPVI